MNIKEVELEFARKLDAALQDTLQDLGYSLPKALQVKASLVDPHGRKKRSTASADNWSPESGRIEIRFEPGMQEAKPIKPKISQVPASPVKSDNHSVSASGLHPAQADLLKALDRAESRPGWNFVPLKKFRDEILLQEHFTSMPTEVERRNVLQTVIDKKLVLTGKVVNPKSPQFPVTTIRLNRLMPEVKALLGQSEGSDLDFRPVEISGEPLSATILRERR